MKKLLFLLSIVSLMALVMSNSGCEQKPIKPNSDRVLQKETEKSMREANRQVGMPAIKNFKEKKTLKWIYELCDQEKMICHCYLMNSLTGKVGQYLGKCYGYGVPYSAQFSNPDKVNKIRGDFGQYASEAVYVIKQPEPNGIFKPEGLSATWVIMVHPKTGQPTPMYVEPEIIVSPFKLH